MAKRTKKVENKASETVMVKRINIMTGKVFEEAYDTPLCCSPASETYWSM